MPKWAKHYATVTLCVYTSLARVIRLQFIVSTSVVARGMLDIGLVILTIYHHFILMLILCDFLTTSVACMQ